MIYVVLFERERDGDECNVKEKAEITSYIGKKELEQITPSII